MLNGISLFQVFHKLRTKTDPNFFKNVEVGDIVKFSHKANGNYFHLSGYGSPQEYVCTMKYDWSDKYDRIGHHKFNFRPLLSKNMINYLVPIANVNTGEIYTCEIRDAKYVILEIRDEKCDDYYHDGSGDYIDILFETTDQPIWNEEQIKKHEEMLRTRK
jgi:hypothetical protein